MLDGLKREVFNANLLLPEHGLVRFTWGNVSGLNRDLGLMVIKPSGVEYKELTPDDMVVVELLTGAVVEGSLKPSSDTPTHLELYRSFPQIGSIVHTHSRWATAFAQSTNPIPLLGTTHADYFHGDIPCTRDMHADEIFGDYETETGRVIVERFNELCLSPMEVPSVLVARHGPFSWGADAQTAVHHAVILEVVAEIAWLTVAIAGFTTVTFPQELLDKHYNRKHGVEAYYGQDEK